MAQGGSGFARVSQPRLATVLAADPADDVSLIFPGLGNVDNIRERCVIWTRIATLYIVAATSGKVARLVPQCEMPHAAGARSFQHRTR